MNSAISQSQVGATPPSAGQSMRWRPIGLALSFLLLLLLLAYVDVVTGPDIRLGLLYCGPTLLMTWYVGGTAGYGMAIVTALVWLCADFFGAALYREPAVAFLNAGTRAISLTIMVRLLNAFHVLSMKLEAKVSERTRAIRELTSELDKVEDSERRQLAQALHDGMGQNLSLLKLNLITSLNLAADLGLKQRLRDATNIVDDLIKRSRTLTFDLHPAMLDHLGLVPTLRQFADSVVAQTGMLVSVHERGTSIKLPPMTTNYIYRAARELINNSLKHGKARQVLVNVFWQPEQLRLVVDDDGSGFDAASVAQDKAPRGLGLATIRERLLSLHGRLRVESEANAGTRVVLEIPLTENDPQ